MFNVVSFVSVYVWFVCVCMCTYLSLSFSYFLSFSLSLSPSLSLSLSSLSLSLCVMWIHVFVCVGCFGCFLDLKNVCVGGGGGVFEVSLLVCFLDLLYGDWGVSKL